MFARVNSAVAIEKEVAADTIGELFNATKSAFLPYVEETMQVLIDLLDHYYEGIRKAAVGALFQYIKTFYELSTPQEWVPGAQVKVPFHADVKKLVDHVLPHIINAWKTEDDKCVLMPTLPPSPPNDDKLYSAHFEPTWALRLHFFQRI